MSYTIAIPDVTYKNTQPSKYYTFPIENGSQAAPVYF